MSQYNIFQGIYASFYSKEFYRDVAKNWGGKAFLYLLMLLALSWIPTCIILQAGLSHGYASLSDKFVQQIPVITVKDGKVITPEKRPYILTSPDGQEPIAIIDTSGQYTNLDQAKTDVLVTETQIITKPKPNELRVYDVPTSLNMVFDPQNANSYAKSFVGIAWIFMFIFFVLGSYVFRIVQALFYSIIGKIFGAMTGAHLAYGQVLSIMLVAITPVIVIATIFDTLNITYAFQHFSYFILAMVYLFYGIIANKN